MTTETLEVTRRKLRFRAWHRGTKEADLMMGRFADVYLPQFGEVELNQFSALLEEQDLDVYGWVIGRDPVPPEHQTGVMDLLQGFDFTVEGLR